MTQREQVDDVSVIMADPIFSEEEKDLIKRFSDETKRRIEVSGFHSDMNLFDIAEAIDLDISALHKEGPVMYALWVVMLSVLKRHYKLEDLKYPSLDSFLETYSGYFDREPEDEKERLWHTANWMSILFTLITPRKNKGLAMQVIPKLVEGWNTKYVTGSGQTHRTASRVHIFESEGNIKANHRGKVKPKKKKRMAKRVPRKFHPTVTGDGAFSEPPKKRQRSWANDQRTESPFIIDGHTDADDDSSINEDVNEDVHQAFKTWSSLPGGGLGDTDLLRSSSVFDLNNSDLSPPSLQRGFSWTEIPISMMGQNNGPPSFQRGPVSSGMSSFSPVTQSSEFCDNIEFVNPPLQGSPRAIPTVVTGSNYIPVYDTLDPKAVRDAFAGYTLSVPPTAVYY